MDVWLCGVRGSSPATGKAFNRYGGRTSCLALAHAGQAPALVLDGGTGLDTLDEMMGPCAFRGTILLSHLHWDHTHGLPFFVAGRRSGHRVRVLLPHQGSDAEAVLARAFSPPHFPVRPSELGQGWSFESVEEGPHEIEGFSVLALEIPHKGGRTLGYRVDDGRASMAYLPDHAPIRLGAGNRRLGVLHGAALTLANGVDLLVHDAQHTAAELPELAYLGHSAGEYAIELARAAGARQVVLFHHAPRRTDSELDSLLASLSGSAVRVSMATEGTLFRLEGSSSGAGR